MRSEGVTMYGAINGTGMIAGRPAAAANPRRARIARRLLGAALAALLVLPSLAATQPAEAGKKSKTVTKTFTSSVPIDVQDFDASNPYPATINVKGFKKFKKARITDVNLTLRGFSHTDTNEVDVLLTHGDRQALVMADAGSNVDVNDLTITLNDEAAEEISSNATLTSGAFRPANHVGNDVFPAPAPTLNGNVALTAFDGTNPDGEWRLFIVDDQAGDAGTIANGWQLEITAKVKEKKGKK
jgi:hypothetical protein